MYFVLSTGTLSIFFKFNVFVVDKKKNNKKKVEMDRDILLPHSGSNEVFKYMC